MLHIPLGSSLSLPTLALISLLCVGHANSAAAAILYSQTSPSEPRATFASFDDTTSAQRIADSFSIGGSDLVTVRSLRFIGGNGQLTVPSDDFRVVFLEDAGGLPGAPILGGDFDIGPAFRRQPTGGPTIGGRGPGSSGGTTPLEYIINLPEGVSLSPETTYWLSITNSLLPISGWGWARAEGESDQTIASTTGSIESGPWNASESGGMWFELNGRIVPEPSLLVLLTSIAVVARARMRPSSETCYKPQCVRIHLTTGKTA